jgi:hypothetical protein
VEIWISVLEGDKKWLAKRPQVNISSEESLVLHLKNSLSAIKKKGRRQRHRSASRYKTGRSNSYQISLVE